VFEEGSIHWELHESLTPRPSDKVLKKYASSAFEGTELARMLAGLEAKKLVLCGLQSEFCVYNTAKSALALGYEVVIAEDGHSTWPSGSASWSRSE
jgi:nicotinamidase-related amidase